MRRLAVFIDAGYFWVQICAQLVGKGAQRTDVTLDYPKLRFALLNELQAQFGHDYLLRIYWYDGPGPNGAKTGHHRDIEALDDFKLRLGMRNGKGQQKAVDGLIIADMISLAQSKAISDAVLVSGDADIAPGVVAAQALGLRVHLLSIGASGATSPYLAAEVDRKTQWDSAAISTFAAPTAVRTPPAMPTTPAPAAAAPGTGTTSITGHAPAAAVIDYAALALQAKASLSGGPLAPLLAGLTASTLPLPSDIDRAILGTARHALKRNLDEAEKRALRKAFRALL